MALINYIPGESPRDIQPDDLYVTTVYFCNNGSCSGISFEGTWSEVNDFWYDNVTTGDGYATMQECDTYCRPNPCEFMNLNVVSMTDESPAGNDGSITCSLSWVYDQTLPVITNVPINLYDSSGNIIATQYINPPEVFTFNNLTPGYYSIGVELSFTYEVNGQTVELPNCVVRRQNVVIAEDKTVFGCSDAEACNYNPETTVDDGSCLYNDCNGDCNGEAYLDNCGNCVGGKTDEIPCEADCNGVFGGTSVIDDCGVCNDPLSDNYNSSCIDCDGVINGPNMIDGCGDCNDPNNATTWNSECAGCKDSCAENYDETAEFDCNGCCINTAIKLNCPCDSTTVPTLELYGIFPDGVQWKVEEVIDGKYAELVIGSGVNYTYNGVNYTQEQDIQYLDSADVVFKVENEILPDGRVYGSTGIGLAEAGGSIIDGFYSVKLRLSAVYNGEVVLDSLEVEKCGLFLCNIEKCLQKHMKRIMLDTQCCDCADLKETFIKAFTLYRAVKIAEHCAIKSDTERAIKRLQEYCKILDNKTCINC
jgi:hypothetical protein